MKTSAKRLLLILGSFALLVASLYAFVSFILPAYNDIQSLRGERDSKVNAIKDAASAEETVKALIDAYSNLSKAEDVFSLILPSGPEIPTLLNQLDGLSRLNGIAIDSTAFGFLALEPSRTELIKPIGKIHINLSLHGKYGDLKTFINNLETNLRIIDIGSLNISGGGSASKEILNYTLEADAYYQ